MYNVFKQIAILVIPSLFILPGCGSSQQENNDGQVALQRAEAMLNQGDPDGCIVLLDSVDGAFASQPEVLRASMALRPRAIEQAARRDILTVDSIIAQATLSVDSLRPMFTHIDVRGTDGYDIAIVAQDESFMNKTGIQGRVSEFGEFYIVSSVCPAGKLQHWSLTANVDGLMASTDTVPYDGALNYRINNGEVVTFSVKGSDAIGELISQHQSSPVTIIFNGQEGKTKNMTLTANQASGIATAYTYAQAISSLRMATIEKQRLEQRIAVALKQQAATANTQTTDNK